MDSVDLESARRAGCRVAHSASDDPVNHPSDSSSLDAGNPGNHPGNHPGNPVYPGDDPGDHPIDSSSDDPGNPGNDPGNPDNSSNRRDNPGNEFGTCRRALLRGGGRGGSPGTNQS